MTTIRWGWRWARAHCAADYSDEARGVLSKLDWLDKAVPPLADAMQLVPRESRRRTFAELIEQAMTSKVRHRRT